MARTDDAALLEKLRSLKEQYPRFGVPRVMAMLKREGAPFDAVNRKRVERLWRLAGLQVARRRRQKRPKPPERSVTPCQAEYPNHVWTYDFIEDALLDGRKIRILNIVDEFTREWVAVKAGVSMSGKAVVATLLPLFREHGVPGFLHHHNEVVCAKRQRRRIHRGRGEGGINGSRGKAVLHRPRFALAERLR